ncbi:flavin-containing monooxygenase [Achromobacter aegrifaciens]|uniref:4-hydroxyacetophenone monooxygenase n=1 Tax=Achromobacter aegrifaciens TaxID=1287736 RepID=A0AAD2IXW5_ACHAE|nr:NAD(P)/FAD-dependent oxidoreductase [Achromobacter aegrifaciens]CUI81298.1 4-hydroxyacetophenone monooxygenase [Achromobacter aegrifaciens]
MHRDTPAPATPFGNDVWEATLKRALASANIPTLLMVLVHLTGDTQWLSERYQCSRIRGLEDNDPGGLPDAVQEEIREAAYSAILLTRRGQQPKLPAPAHEQLVAMLRTSIGEDVPDSYGPMIAAWLGLDPDFALEQHDAFQVPQGYRVLVIGAGVAGLCAAIRLQGAGIPYVVIEKNAEVGGTWYENRYPGAGVDTPNHIYSYSFAKHDWSRYFALQGEIQGYFESVADQRGVRPNIRFNTRVESARYDEDALCWNIRTVGQDGQVQDYVADILISAVGLLNVPKLPPIPGLESFKGPCFHTANWPEGLDLRGKNVGIIGNGASSMQVVPAIADQVRSLTVFQRSKQWAAPFEKFQKPVPEDVRFLLREVPYYQEWYRQRLAWIFNDRVHATLQIDPQWPHPERAINQINDRHREHFTSYIKAELGDRQDLLPDVLPDYPPFGKRMLMDNGWFRTMARDHVQLVTGGIARVTENAVVSDNGRAHELDVLVVATGFDAINLLSSFKLYGRGGRSIREAWDEKGAEAFMGVAAPGFPNLFILAGPNTALGHGGSVVALLETQVRYVMGLLQQGLDKAGGRFEIEVRRDRHDAYNARVQAAHDRMIWTHKGMSNWYRNAHGKVVAPTPFRNDDYWHMLRKTDMGDYHYRPASGEGETEPSAATRVETA